MFLCSLGVSWIFNAYLASVDRQELQKEILTTAILGNPTLDTVGFQKWTSLVAFAAVYLEVKPEDTRAILDEMIPNNTEVGRELRKQLYKQRGKHLRTNRIRKDSMKKRGDCYRTCLSTEQARIGYEAAKGYKMGQQRQVRPAQNAYRV